MASALRLGVKFTYTHKTTAHNPTQIDDYRQDWRILPAQLVGRLIGYEQEGKERDIVELVRTVQQWPGAGDGWWCPVNPLCNPAKHFNIST